MVNDIKRNVVATKNFVDKMKEKYSGNPQAWKHFYAALKRALGHLEKHGLSCPQVFPYAWAFPNKRSGQMCGTISGFTFYCEYNGDSISFIDCESKEYD